jgi:flavodoxin
MFKFLKVGIIIGSLLGNSLLVAETIEKKKLSSKEVNEKVNVFFSNAIQKCQDGLKEGFEKEKVNQICSCLIKKAKVKYEYDIKKIIVASSLVDTVEKAEALTKTTEATKERLTEDLVIILANECAPKEYKEILMEQIKNKNIKK